MMKQFLMRALFAGALMLTLAIGTPRSASAANYTLTLVQIECLDKEDSVANGRDEPYIELNGNRIWSGSGFTNGTSQNSLGAFVIGSTANLRLWEEDSWPDADDHIGSITVTSAVAGLGNRTVILTGAGGEYSITYRVN